MRFGRLLILCLMGVLLHPSAAAQATGLYPFGPFDTRGFDTINRGNLNIHFSIPVFSKPGRGGNNFAYSLVYDGLVWAPQNASGLKVWTPSPQWGWTDSTNAQWGYVTYDETLSTCSLPPKGLRVPYTTYTNYVYHDDRGATHTIPFSWVPACGGGGPTGTATYSLNDNSGYTIYRTNNSFVAFTRYGAQFSVPTYADVNGQQPVISPATASSTDTNGNVISASSSGAFIDTMGKTALTLSGSGTPSSPVVYTYTDSNGNGQTLL